jgi:hypothetical protein
MAWNAAGGAESVRVTGTPRTVPGAPTNLLVSASAGNTDLSWELPATTGGSEITDYVIQYSANSGSTWTTFADGTSTTRSARLQTGTLTLGTTYVYRVATVNAVGTGSYTTASSPALFFTNPDSVDLAGSQVQASLNTTTGEITLSWEASPSNGGSPITDYLIEHMADESGVWHASSDPGVSTATTVSLGTNFLYGSYYQFRVTAITAVGQSTASLPNSSLKYALTPQFTNAQAAATVVSNRWVPASLDWGTNPQEAQFVFDHTALNARGSVISLYTVTCQGPAGTVTASSHTGTVVVSGLTAGQTHTCGYTISSPVGSTSTTAALKTLTAWGQNITYWYCPSTVNSNYDASGSYVYLTQPWTLQTGAGPHSSSVTCEYSAYGYSYNWGDWMWLWYGLTSPSSSMFVWRGFDLS